MTCIQKRNEIRQRVEEKKEQKVKESMRVGRQAKDKEKKEGESERKRQDLCMKK